MTKRNPFYAQSGGVTAVINAGAAGVIEAARKHKDRIGKVYGGRNGIIGDVEAVRAACLAALQSGPATVRRCGDI
jgi:6-phosphofructokinase